MSESSTGVIMTPNSYKAGYQYGTNEWNQYGDAKSIWGCNRADCNIMNEISASSSYQTVARGVDRLYLYSHIALNLWS
jgi:hypothetical protein